MRQKTKIIMLSTCLSFALLSIMVAQESGRILQAVDLMQGKEYEKARSILLATLQTYPENEAACFNLGKIYFLEDDFENAISYFEKAVKLNSKVPDYYIWLGKSYEGIFPEATVFSFASLIAKMKSSFRTAIKLEPNNVEARYKLAEVLNNGSPLFGGSKKGAIEQLEIIKKLDPQKGYELSAYFHWYNAEWEPAIQDYLKYLEKDTGNAGVYCDMGICYMQISDNDRAFESLSSALLIDANHDEAHYYLGRLYLKRGETQLARSEFEKAQQINPKEGRYSEALNNLTKK